MNTHPLSLVMLIIILGAGLVWLSPIDGQEDPTAHERAARQGEYHLAWFHLQTEAAAHGWNAAHHEAAANYWEALGDSGRARAHLEAAVRLNPSLDTLRRLADDALAQGAWYEAHRRLNQMLGIDPTHAWATRQQGYLLAPTAPTQARTWLTSLVDVKEALADDASDTDRLTHGIITVLDETPRDQLAVTLGRAFATAQAWPFAENAYQAAADEGFPDAASLASVGLVRQFQGKDGSTQIDLALQIDPADPYVRRVEGVYWRNEGDVQRSLDAFYTALTLEPNGAINYAELANTFRSIGNLIEAEFWLSQAQQVAADHPAVQEAVIRLSTDEALLMPLNALTFTRVNTPGAEDPSLMAARGYALHSLGDSVSGLRMIDRALNVDPDNPRARFDRARLLIETGQAHEAVATLRELSEEDHGFARLAQRLLDSIE